MANLVPSVNDLSEVTDPGLVRPGGSGSPGAEEEPAVPFDALVHELKEKLDLLVVCFSHSWGGLEQTAANDALDLAEQGLKVRLLCMKGTPIEEQLSRRPEVRVTAIDYRPRDFLDFALKADLESLILDGVNVIHTHQTTFLGSLVPWVWKRKRVSLFASRHILNNHRKRNLFHRLIYSRLDALLVMSRTLRRNVLDTHPLRERKVRVVSLGLDFDHFNPDKVDAVRQRAEWGADPETIVIGLVGRIDPAKGQGTFIKAAAGLLKSKKPDEKLKFVIVGEETLGQTSTYLAELREMVRQFRMEESVVFAGFKENIPEVMASFDLFVMPSRQEAFGLVAIEAMAMECPIVVSSGGSASEIIGQEEYGLLMRPDDAFDLARQLRYLLDHPEVRVKMGKSARSHVLKHYDRRVRLHRTMALYERSIRARAALRD